MIRKARTSSGSAATASPSKQSAHDKAKLDQAFEALKTYDYGSNRGALMPIDDAVIACLRDDEARGELERRLIVALKDEISRVATEYVCRKLCPIASRESVPTLAALLADRELSHMARTVLEHIPHRDADKALRKSLREATGLQKVGVINSLGARGDSSSVRALEALLKDPDEEIARAAAAGLGNIGTSKAGRELRKFLPKAPRAIRSVVADACLACAESLARVGKKNEAHKIHEALADSRLPEHIRSAVARNTTTGAAEN